MPGYADRLDKHRGGAHPKTERKNWRERIKIVANGDGKGTWLDPKFILTLALIVGGWFATYKVLEYRVDQLEKKVAVIQQQDIVSRIKNVEDATSKTKDLVVKIANKMGIEVLQ